MRNRIYPALILLFLIVVIALVFFLIYENSQSIGKEAVSKFNVPSVSKTNDLVGPIDEVLGVTFQYAFDLGDGVSFSDLGIYDATVKSVTKGKDTGYIEIVKGEKTIQLPLVGFISFKKLGSDKFEPLNVKELGGILDVGDTVTVYTLYVSPLSTNTTKEIREKLMANSPNEPITKEAKLWVNSITNTGLTENEILSMLSRNKLVKFNSNQTSVRLIELKSK